MGWGGVGTTVGTSLGLSPNAAVRARVISRRPEQARPDPLFWRRPDETGLGSVEPALHAVIVAVACRWIDVLTADPEGR